MWEIGVRGKVQRMMKNLMEGARSAVMLDGECLRKLILVFHKELHRDVHHHPIYSRCMLMT